MKPTMKNGSKKLQFNKETLRQLTSQDLLEARGGAKKTESGGTCWGTGMCTSANKSCSEPDGCTHGGTIGTIF